MGLLEVEGLEVAYGRAQALRGVTLVADRGQRVGLVGPNGAGKSTLLRAIQGLLRPVAGAIRLAGERIDGLAPHEVVERGVGYVPEGRRLFGELTVRENLEMGAYPLRGRGRMAEGFALVFDLFPVLRERAGQPARTLSGGEQQMLAVARGLMGWPRLLLLDDPFLGLGPGVTAKLCETLRRLSGHGLTLLVAGQHVRRILGLGERAYLLDTGRIALEGPGPELLASDAVRRALFGTGGQGPTPGPDPGPRPLLG